MLMFTQREHSYAFAGMMQYDDALHTTASF